MDGCLTSIYVAFALQWVTCRKVQGHSGGMGNSYALFAPWRDRHIRSVILSYYSGRNDFGIRATRVLLKCPSFFKTSPLPFAYPFGPSVDNKRSATRGHSPWT